VKLSLFSAKKSKTLTFFGSADDWPPNLVYFYPPVAERPQGFPEDDVLNLLNRQ